MSKDLFGDIDINDLANSEEAIIDTTSNIVKSKSDSADKVDDKKDKEDSDDNDGGIDINLISNLGSDDDDGSDDESGKDTKKVKTPAIDAKASSSSQSALPSLALVLQEAGVFSSLTEEDLKDVQSVEDIVKAVEKQIKANELADLSEEDRSYIEARRNGVSHNEFIQTKANSEQYEKLTDELIEANEQLQFELIRRSFLIKGIDEKTASKLATKSVEDEDSLDEALEARQALIDYENKTLQDKITKAKEKADANLNAEKVKLESLKSKINENSEILPGVKVNSQTKDKIFNSMTTPVKSKDNKLQNEVMDLYSSDAEYKMKIHALHILTKGFTDFSKFKNDAKSTAVKDLEEKLAQTGSGSTGRSTSKSVSVSGGSTTKEMIAALPSFGPKR
jgi:hypothetical protein